MNRIGIVGCGQMGSGIAQVCAENGLTTLMSDISHEFVEKGIIKMKGFMAKSVEKGKMTKEAMDAAISNIRPSTNLEDLKDCDIVIEAIVEDFESKKKMFAQLDKICQPSAILATNTSSIPIIQIANCTSRPDKVIGMHFFNPVPIMKLVEIVRSAKTGDDTYAKIKELSAKLGKTGVTCKDKPGFIVNLLLTPYLLDGIRLLEDGSATKEDIDAAMKLGCGLPMGPLELSDFIGLDTVMSIAEVLHKGYNDPKFATPGLLKNLVAEKKLGRKTKIGIYSYEK